MRKEVFATFLLSLNFFYKKKNEVEFIASWCY